MCLCFHEIFHEATYFDFDNTSADFVLMSADVLLKMIIILCEMKLLQLFCRFEDTKRTIRNQLTFTGPGVPVGMGTWGGVRTKFWQLP